MLGGRQTITSPFSHRTLSEQTETALAVPCVCCSEAAVLHTHGVRIMRVDVMRYLMARRQRWTSNGALQPHPLLPTDRHAMAGVALPEARMSQRDDNDGRRRLDGKSMVVKLIHSSCSCRKHAHLEQTFVGAFLLALLPSAPLRVYTSVCSFVLFAFFLHSSI